MDEAFFAALAALERAKVGTPDHQCALDNVMKLAEQKGIEYSYVPLGGDSSPPETDHAD